MNFYSYANGDPADFVDTTGEAAAVAVYVVGAGFALAAAGYTYWWMTHCDEMEEVTKDITDLAPANDEAPAQYSAIWLVTGCGRMR